MSELIKKISNYGIVPVIKIDNVETAVPLAEALIDAGLPVAEVTFRTAQAEESIKRIVQSYPEMLVGAGTVLSVEQVDKAVNAGAKFIVTPGFNHKVVSNCISNKITVIPGTSTPSDMEKALEMGLEVVKFFPAARRRTSRAASKAAPAAHADRRGPRCPADPTGNASAVRTTESRHGMPRPPHPEISAKPTAQP